MPVELVLKYDRTSDALYIKIKEGVVRESEEISPGVIVDYDEKGEVIGIEILWFSKIKIDLSRFITEGPEALVLYSENKVHNTCHRAVKTERNK